jgi:hypothetical protein
MAKGKKQAKKRSTRKQSYEGTVKKTDQEAQETRTWWDVLRDFFVERKPTIEEASSATQKRAATQKKRRIMKDVRGREISGNSIFLVVKITASSRLLNRVNYVFYVIIVSRLSPPFLQI